MSVDDALQQLPSMQELQASQWRIFENVLSTMCHSVQKLETLPSRIEKMEGASVDPSKLDEIGQQLRFITETLPDEIEETISTRFTEMLEHIGGTESQKNAAKASLKAQASSRRLVYTPPPKLAPDKADKNEELIKAQAHEIEELRRRMTAMEASNERVKQAVMEMASANLSKRIGNVEREVDTIQRSAHDIMADLDPRTKQVLRTGRFEAEDVDLDAEDSNGEDNEDSVVIRRSSSIRRPGSSGSAETPPTPPSRHSTPPSDSISEKSEKKGSPRDTAEEGEASIGGREDPDSKMDSDSLKSAAPPQSPRLNHPESRQYPPAIPSDEGHE